MQCNHSSRDIRGEFYSPNPQLVSTKPVPHHMRQELTDLFLEAMLEAARNDLEQGIVRLPQAHS